VPLHDILYSLSRDFYSIFEFLIASRDLSLLAFARDLSLRAFARHVLGAFARFLWFSVFAVLIAARDLSLRAFARHFVFAFARFLRL
jgi:hypothetical protein